MILGKLILIILVILVVAWLLGGFLRNYRR
jgi:flagellar biogenesis protein FliO